MNVSGEGFEFVTSFETDQAIDTIVDAMIEIDEEGTDLSDTVGGGKILARASLMFDLRRLNPDLQVSGEKGWVESALRILIERVMDAHLCQCPLRDEADKHSHGTRSGPCTGHTRTLDEPRLCADCA